MAIKIELRPEQMPNGDYGDFEPCTPGHTVYASCDCDCGTPSRIEIGTITSRGAFQAPLNETIWAEQHMPDCPILDGAVAAMESAGVTVQELVLIAMMPEPESIMAAAKQSTPRALVIAWKSDSERAHVVPNLCWAYISDPQFPASAHLCPVVGRGGCEGYVMGPRQVSSGHWLEELLPQDRKAVEVYRDEYMATMEGEIVVDFWLDERPEWLYL